MDLMHIRIDDFIKNPKNFSLPLCDKESLKNQETINNVIQEINNIYETIEINTYISRNNRNIICKIMALYFLVTDDSSYSDKCKIISEILKESISKHISKTIKSDIRNILKNFKSNLINPKEDNIIHKIGKLDLNEKTVFDNLMMSDKPNLKQEISDNLKDNSVWYIRVNHRDQKVHIKGELSEDEISKKISCYDKNVFEYTQEQRKHITPDMSGCLHSGCYINKHNEYVENSRIALHGDIKQIFQKIEVPTSKGGTVGIFLNDGKRCHLDDL